MPTKLNPLLDLESWVGRRQASRRRQDTRHRVARSTRQDAKRPWAALDGGRACRQCTHTREVERGEQRRG